MSQLPEGTKTIHIRGMFCAHCEERIRGALLALPGVENADVSWEKETAVVWGDSSFWDGVLFQKAIEDAGYEMTTARESHIQTVSVLVILLAIWTIASHMGWTQIFNLFPRIETSLSLGALFLTGLLTSVHCLAMCGGISLTQSVMASSDKQRIIRSNALYHAGRVLSYTLIGTIAGGIGQALSPSGIFKGLVAILAGAAMLVMALNMLGVFRVLRKLSPRFSGRAHASLFIRFRNDSSIVIGLLNGLMPCGPLQAMQNDGSQTLRTEIDYGSYHSVRIKAGVPSDWTITVPEGKLNGCNGEILIPAYQVVLVLQEGENHVAFLPDQPGIIPYSCWMGMIRGTIEVRD